ncbi:restriction endonuclease subunit S [Thiobacillus sp.]
MSGSESNWQSRPLGELATTTSGGTPSRKRKDYYGGSIPWVKSGELNDDYIFETEEHITEAGLKNSSAKIFSSGTVLIALYGATVGKTSILRTDASTNQAVCGITPGPDLDAGYLRYHLISLRRELLSHRYGGAQPNISQQIVRNQKIAYPPLPEQKKIAHILSTVQRAIEAQERIIQTTTELKKALMHKLFTEGLRNEPQKQTEIGPVPASWDVVELGKLAKVGNGSTPKRANEAYWEDGTIPWLNSTKIHDRFITEADQFVTPQAVKECHLPKVAPKAC